MRHTAMLGAVLLVLAAAGAARAQEAPTCPTEQVWIRITGLG